MEDDLLSVAALTGEFADGVTHDPAVDLRHPVAGRGGGCCLDLPGGRVKTAGGSDYPINILKKAGVDMNDLIEEAM